MNKTISILIAAFKAELWLEQCVDSIRRQELPDGWELEIIIGVDGCLQTLRVARQIDMQDLKIISLKENYGTYVTFNTLMKFATGELICRFDADDAMMPGYISEQLDYLQHNSHMTTAWSISTDETLCPRYPEAPKINKQTICNTPQRVAEGNFIIRQSVWKELGGFQPWRCGADTDFKERVNVLGLCITVVEKPLYYRRKHANSLTAHPATNFNSELRQSIIDKVVEYAAAYQCKSRPLMLTPVYGEVDEVYE